MLNSQLDAKYASEIKCAQLIDFFIIPESLLHLHGIQLHSPSHSEKKTCPHERYLQETNLRSPRARLLDFWKAKHPLWVFINVLSTCCGKKKKRTGETMSIVVMLY